MKIDRVMRVTLEHDILDQLLGIIRQWIADNPEILILDINIDQDDCQGGWFVYIYYGEKG